MAEFNEPDPDLELGAAPDPAAGDHGHFQQLRLSQKIPGIREGSTVYGDGSGYYFHKDRIKGKRRKMLIPNSLQCLLKHSHRVLVSSVKFSKLMKNLSLESRSSVSTSALATTFNSRPERKLKFGFSKNETGLFEIPELQTPDGFHLLKDSVVRAADKLVEESHSPARSRKIVEIFDELSDTLCKVADLAEFIRIAHPDPKFAKAARDTCIVVSGIVEKMNTNKNLYLSLKHVVVNGDTFPTTEIDDHVNMLFLEDFEQCGIHLEEEKRKLVVALNDCILQKGQEFMTAAVKPRVAPSEIIPKNIQHFFYVEGDKTIISGLCSELPNELAREAAFKIFLYPIEEQEQLLSEILEARYKLAQLCGFQSYAHRALKLSLAETPENVGEFLNLLSKELRPKAENEFNVMMKMKEVENDFTPLRPWDIPYFAKKGKKSLLKVESGEFSPYFSLGACMEGLNFLFNRLYGVHFENEPVQSGETWAPDIHKLAVVDESGNVLGHIYCDFFERDNKPNQDCHFTIRGGKRLADGTYQNPVVVLMLNLLPPRWSGPSLLTPSNVENLFHEMGHAMHSMFARTQYQHVTGTRCSTDFAEVPSVLMEFFASDPRVLRSFAKHFMTQEPMPDDMMNRLCASKRMFGASEMQLQVFYSVLDQTYHGEFPLKGSTTEILAETQKQHYCVPYVPNTAWQLRFTHLIGYGGKYYSYLMSRAVASWIWQSNFKSDPFSREAGERFREQCLSHGGGKPLRMLVSDFLNRDVTPTNLVSALIQDLEADESPSNNTGEIS